MPGRIVSPEERKRIWKAAGARIKLAREQIGITQEDLCLELSEEELVEAKLDVRTLRRYENEGALRWKTIKIFAGYFKVSEELLTDLELPDETVADAMIIAKRGSKGVPLSAKSTIPEKSRQHPGAMEIFQSSTRLSIPRIDDVEATSERPGEPKASGQPESFLTNSKVLAILREMALHSDFSLLVAGKQLYDKNRRIETDWIEQLSKENVIRRINLLAERLGVANINLDGLIHYWEKDARQGAPVTRQRLLELARTACEWSFETEDTSREWRSAVEKRIYEVAPTLLCVPRFPGPPSSELLNGTLELAPLLVDWPSRLLKHPEWVYVESPIPGIEPMTLDDMWVDIDMIDPLETDPTTLERDFASSLDARYEERSWRTQPAVFILERLRGAAALIGAPGSGKTTLLKWIARQVVKQPSGRFLLPLYVSLRRYVLEHREGDSLLTFALKCSGIVEPGQIRLWVSILSYMSGLEKRTVFLLLDGWDEVPVEHREALRGQIATLGQGFAFLITSRPSAYPRALPVEKVYEIAELSPKSIHFLIRQWFQNVKRPEGADILNHHMDRHPDLRRLARNPFLLTLLCGIAFKDWEVRGGKSPKLPASRTALYEEAIGWIAAHQSARYPEAPFDERRKQQVERLAVWLFTQAPGAPRFIFNDEHVRTCTADDELLPQVLRPSRLISQWNPEGDALHFIHASFQEYLAARGMLRDSRSELNRCIEEHALDGAWQEILRFIASGEGEFKETFWNKMRKIAETPDRFGLVYIRLAYLLADAGSTDGGVRLLGVDIRDQLWPRIIEGGEFINLYVDAFAEFDAHEYIRRIKRQGNNDERVKPRLLRSLRRVRHRESSRLLIGKILRGDKLDSAAATFAAPGVVDGEALKQLREFLLDSHNPLKGRQDAARVLGEARDFESMGALLEVSEKEPEMSYTGLLALGQIGGDAVAAALFDLFFRTEDIDMRQSILNSIGRTRSPGARDGLLAQLALCGPDDPMVLGILTALIRTPISKNSGIVSEFLRHQDEKVRIQAARALEGAVESKATEALSRAARYDKSPEVRKSALTALHNNARTKDAHWLAEIADSETTDDSERSSALAALLSLAGRFRHDCEYTWLLRLGLETAGRALEKLSGDLPFAASYRGHLLGQEFAPRLLGVCIDEAFSPSVREGACISIGKLKYREATDTLLQLMRREPDVPSDEEEPEINRGKRLATAAADALANIDAARLLAEPGLTARNALLKFSIRTGSLVFQDYILDTRGRAKRSGNSPAL